MAAPVLPNPDNFMGVALVINRSRDGPRLVFHYPKRKVLPPGVQEDGEGEEDLDDDDDRHGGPEAGASSTTHAAEMASWNYDDHIFTENGTQLVPWEYVAGYPTKDLENLLTPNRAYHKRLFQVSLDNVYCVSYPIYVPENGIWQKKKKKKKQEQEQHQGESGPGAKDDDALPTETDAGIKSGDRGATDGEPLGAGDAEGKEKGDKEKKASMTMFNLVFFLRPKKHEAKDLVDIMYTNIIKKINKAYKYCQERSDFVWKESKKILTLKDKGREERRKMSLLWEEILSTSSLAASMRDLYEAVSQNRIAALQLGTAEGMVTHSVQIPVPFHVSDLPDNGEAGQPGLWLTTANTLMGDDAVEEPEFLDKNFALLLLVDEKRIITELQDDPDETTLAMIEFVRHCKPTLSFYQVGQQSSNVLSPTQVRKFAQHFIFWRRAIAIPPLHARDMYIVSPNCDMRKLPQAATQWARQFPLVPALPNFLAELSVAPRPYKLHCPSKAHRPTYMAMLAWLMRGGWVTQLCTFAYVVVWPEIIYEVEHALEAEQIAKEKKAQAMAHEADSAESDDAVTVISPTTATATGTAAALSDPSLSGFLPLLNDPPTTPSNPDSSPNTTTSVNFTDFPIPLSHSQSLTNVQKADWSPPQSPNTPRNLHDPRYNILGYRIVQPRPQQPQPQQQQPQQPPATASTSSLDLHSLSLRSPSSPSPSSSQDSGSGPTTQAEEIAEKARLSRIASRAAHDLAERSMLHARKPVPMATLHPSVNHAKHLQAMSPHIILDAKKATGKESLYLSAIAKRFKERAAEARLRRGREGGIVGGGGGGGGAGQKQTTGSDTKSTASFGGNRNLSGGGGGGGGVGTSNHKHDSDDQHQQQLEWEERVANAWPLFLKYFNGRSALERIALQEEMKRKDVWNLLTAMSEYLLTVRHW
ncbi:nitrogen permease regulator of amino acid transport activity 3-domain-containing protein [Apiosordaria backusii]|uniref:Nitrogen permease regulator 3 n=1 Tax=Apiosordaria backusii TaxID=314023 RepID=A0AA40BNT7_9PEZI|nr:nitrogen permease regulator of amino acid transport activity 3-domain-containing protein [Apiosordaria backusii]